MDPDRINITICGDGGCGKSSITVRLVHSQWTHEYDPTIEDSYSVTRTIDGRTCLLSITDTAGQEEYRSLQSSYSRNADAFLLVYDITNPASLHEQLPYFLELIAQEKEAREEAGQVAPVAIVAGNKCDLKDERRVSAREGLEWARSRGCGFMETSAREFVNVEETFALLVRRVLAARNERRQSQTTFQRVTSRASRGSPRSPQSPQSPRSAHSHFSTTTSGKRSKLALVPPPLNLSPTRDGPPDGMNNGPGDSFSRTQPLTPIEPPEKLVLEKEKWWKRIFNWKKEKPVEEGKISSSGAGGGGYFAAERQREQEKIQKQKKLKKWSPCCGLY